MLDTVVGAGHTAGNSTHANPSSSRDGIKTCVDLGSQGSDLEDRTITISSLSSLVALFNVPNIMLGILYLSYSFLRRTLFSQVLSLYFCR